MKKISKTFIAIMLCVGLIISMSVLVGAAAPTLRVESVSGQPGNIVAVKIMVENNPGVAAMNLVLNYDKTKIIPQSVTPGSAFPVGNLVSNIQQGGNMASYDKVTLFWVNPFNNTKSGEFATVRFKILNGANGEIPLTLTYEKEDVINQTYEEIEFAVENGSVTVEGGSSTSAPAQSGTAPAAGDKAAENNKGTDGGETVSPNGPASPATVTDGAAADGKQMNWFLRFLMLVMEAFGVNAA